jgi:hypothetical protein
MNKRQYGSPTSQRTLARFARRVAAIVRTKMILPKNDSATLQTQPLKPEQRPGRTINGRTIFGIGFKDRKDDDASNDLLLRIAAGAAHAKRVVRQ